MVIDNGNPYQSPGSDPQHPAHTTDPKAGGRYSQWFLLGRALLMLYNVFFLCFTVFYAVGATLQIATGQRGLPVPEHIGALIAVVFCSLAILTTLGNWLLLFLVLWMLAARRGGDSVFYRVWLAVLVFVPVWGLHHYQQVVGPTEKTEP